MNKLAYIILGLLASTSSYACSFAIDLNSHLMNATPAILVNGQCDNGMALNPNSFKMNSNGGFKTFTFNPGKANNTICTLTLISEDARTEYGKITVKGYSYTPIHQKDRCEIRDITPQGLSVIFKNK